MNGTVNPRQQAQNFLLVTQIFLGIGGILIPVAAIEFYALFETFWERCTSKSKALRVQGDVLELRTFLFLQLLTAVVLIAEMAVPVYVQPLPYGLDCTAFAITVWYVSILFNEIILTGD